MSDGKQNTFFIPLVVLCTLLALICAILLMKTMSPAPLNVVDTENLVPDKPQHFELLISTFAKDKQTIELLEEEFEYWFKQSVSRKIVTTVPKQIEENIPKVIKDTVLGSDLNTSSADIIVKCKAIVEIECSFGKPDDWKVTIEDDTAIVTAPPLKVDTINIPPEHIRAWVIQEELFIDGEREKDMLKYRCRQKLIPYVRTKDFINARKERCRGNLESYFKNQFQLLPDKRLKNIKHVYVRFTDDAE